MLAVSGWMFYNSFKLEKEQWMLKFIFELVIEPLGLPIKWYWEWCILTAIGLVSYGIAFSKVGEMYHSKTISGRGTGSIIHWVIRLFCFVVIWAITYGVIWVVKFVIRHRKIIILSLLGILIIVILGRVVFRIHKRKQYKTEKIFE